MLQVFLWAWKVTHICYKYYNLSQIAAHAGSGHTTMTVSPIQFKFNKIVWHTCSTILKLYLHPILLVLRIHLTLDWFLKNMFLFSGFSAGKAVRDLLRNGRLPHFRCHRRESYKNPGGTQLQVVYKDDLV